MDKGYAIYLDNGKWFVETQENRHSFWVGVAGPFDTQGLAHDALVKMQDDEARAEYEEVAKLDTGEPVIHIDDTNS